MAEEDKKSVMKHEHPLYPWLALVFSVIVIFGVAGWYILAYQSTVDDDSLVAIRATYQPIKGENNGTAEATASDQATDIQGEVDKIDVTANGVSESSIDTAQLDNTNLGVQ